MAVGGVALFPSDTVYGLATEPESEEGVRRLYALKRRPPGQPAAVMFFDLELALAALPELGPRTAAALPRLLPGGVTLLLPNPARRYPLACGPHPETPGPARARPDRRAGAAGRGALAAAAVQRQPLRRTRRAPAGGRARRASGAGVDVQLDAGELPGVASTVVDLTGLRGGGPFRVVREGALSAESVAQAL